MGALALTVAGALRPLERASERASRHVETCHALATSSSCLLSIPFPFPFPSFHSFIHPLSFTLAFPFFHSFGAAPMCVTPFPFYLFIPFFFSRVSACICCWGWKEGVHTRFLSFPCAIHKHIPTTPFFSRPRTFFFFSLLILLKLSISGFFFFLSKRSVSSF